LNRAKITGTIEEGYNFPKTMKVRARYEAENERKREREREVVAERERTREREECRVCLRVERNKGVVL
jgi:hypothetical protein